MSDEKLTTNHEDWRLLGRYTTVNLPMSDRTVRYQSETPPIVKHTKVAFISDRLDLETLFDH